MRRPDGESHRGALPRRRHPLRGAGRVRLRRGTDLAPGPRGRNRQLHEGEPHVLRLCLGNGTRHRNPRRRRRTPHRGPVPREGRGRSLQGDRRRRDSHARQRYAETRVRRRRRGPLRCAAGRSRTRAQTRSSPMPGNCGPSAARASAAPGSRPATSTSPSAPATRPGITPRRSSSSPKPGDAPRTSPANRGASPQKASSPPTASCTTKCWRRCTVA